MWRFLDRTQSGHMRWTDDTQVSLDLAESLMAQGELMRTTSRGPFPYVTVGATGDELVGEIPFLLANRPDESQTRVFR